MSETCNIHSEKNFCKKNTSQHGKKILLSSEKDFTEYEQIKFEEICTEPIGRKHAYTNIGQNHRQGQIKVCSLFCI